MYSIFWRIFASFWVVVLAAEYAAVWSTAVVSEPELHPALDHTNRQFVLNSGRGANVLRERGLEAYRSWRADKSNLGAIAALTMEDNGPGIPESMLAKVFDPFVRVSAAREKETGGYGIGLSIVKRAISLHGGTISARNNEGYPGLTMTISLPARTRDRRVRAI